MGCIEKGLLGINIRTQNIAIAIIQMVIHLLSGFSNHASIINILDDYQKIDNDTTYNNLIHR